MVLTMLASRLTSPIRHGLLGCVLGVSGVTKSDERSASVDVLDDEPMRTALLRTGSIVAAAAWVGFAAREVLVGTLGLVYGMEADEDDPVELREAIRADVNAETGKPRHTPLSGLALMVFFVYACQCMSTLAVVRRETNSWKWTLFMFFSMTAIAYVAALLVFQGGRALGFG